MMCEGSRLRHSTPGPFVFRLRSPSRSAASRLLPAARNERRRGSVGKETAWVTVRGVGWVVLSSSRSSLLIHLRPVREVKEGPKERVSRPRGVSDKSEDRRVQERVTTG